MDKDINNTNTTDSIENSSSSPSAIHTNTNIEKCPCCPNHCPADTLECGKGRRYFQQKGDEGGQSQEDILLHQFRACAHYFRYGMGEKAGQQRILSMLDRTGIITQKELQDMLGVQSGSLSEILNKVEAGGYIIRRQNEKDRRQMDLELTESGKESAHGFKREREQMVSTMFADLTEEERKQLSALLTKMMEHWPRTEEAGHRGRWGRRGDGSRCDDRGRRGDGSRCDDRGGYHGYEEGPGMERFRGEHGGRGFGGDRN